MPRFVPVGAGGQPLPASIHPTGIGLIDAILNSVYRDPLGGLGTIVGLPQATNELATTLLPGVFQSLARRPETFHVFGRQEFPAAAAEGRKLLGQSFSVSEMRKAVMDALTESPNPLQAMRAIRQVIGQDALDLLGEETGAEAQAIRLAPDYSLFNRFTPPHEVAHSIQRLHGLGGYPSPRVVERLRGLESLAQTGPRSPEEHAIQILGEFYSGARRGLPK